MIYPERKGVTRVIGLRKSRRQEVEAYEQAVYTARHLKRMQRSNAAWMRVPANPEWTAEDFARARPARKWLPDLVAAYLRTRGKQKRPTKVLVSLRLERDVVERLRASGPGWQSRANDMLRKAVLER